MTIDNFNIFISSLSSENPKKDVSENYIRYRKNKLIEISGSESKLNLILESGFTEEELFESGLLDMLMGKIKGTTGNKMGDILSGGVELGAKTILTSMLQPLITKLNITSQSFLWYFLTYGMTEVITKLGKDILNLEQPQFCQTFTDGAVKGVYAYFSAMGYSKISQLLGFGNYNDLATSVMINMSDNISKESVNKWVYGAVCGNGKSGGMYNIIKNNLNFSDLATIF